MHTTIEMSALAKALTSIKPAVAKGTVALPVLSGVRVDANDGTLTLTCTNLERTAVATVPCTVTVPGSTVVSHADLLKTVKAARKGVEGVLGVDDGSVIVNHHIRRELPELTPEEFPRLPELDGDGLVAAVDPEGLARVARFASDDDHRPILTGILFDTDGMTATDSYRLINHPVDGLAGSWLVPASVCALAAKAAKGEVVTLNFSDDYTRLGTGGPVTWYVRSLVGEFPNWKGIMPAPGTAPTTAVIDVGEASQLVKEIGGFAKDKATPLRLTVGDGRIEFRVVQDGGDDKCSAEMPAVTTGPDVTAAFNTKYLLETLDSGADRVKVGLVDHLKPAVFEPVDSEERSILMPVRVQ